MKKECMISRKAAIATFLFALTTDEFHAMQTAAEQKRCTAKRKKSLSLKKGK